MPSSFSLFSHLKEDADFKYKFKSYGAGHLTALEQLWCWGQNKYLCRHLVCHSVYIWIFFVLSWISKLQENNDRKTLMLHRIVCFQAPEKGFIPEVFLGFKFRGETLSLSLKLHYFKGVVSNNLFRISTSVRIS